MKIHLLDNNAFRGAQGKPTEGLIAHTFIGKICLNQTDIVRAYLKIYNPVCKTINEFQQTSFKENKEPENEAIGYTLANCCGLKVPKSAGFIRLKRNQIPNPPTWIGDGDQIAWFSQDEACESLGVLTGLAHFDPTSARVRKLKDTLIEQLEHTAGVAAFDATINNLDRNPGNILASDPWTLIDHGRILAGEYWNPDILNLKKFHKNTKNLIELYISEQSEKLNYKNSRKLAGENQVKLYEKNKNIFYWLLDEILYLDDIKSASAIKEFIEYRLSNVNSAKAIGLVA